MKHSQVFRAIVVDDDSVFRLVSSKHLDKHAHFQASGTFKDGRDVLDWLQAQSARGSYDSMPHLMLLDINMPRLDGWGVMEAFNEEACSLSIKVVIITSSIDPQDYERSKRYQSVIDYMTKPLNKDKLDRIADNLIATKNDA